MLSMGFSPFLPAYLKYQKTIDISIKKYYNKKVISKTKKSISFTLPVFS